MKEDSKLNEEKKQIVVLSRVKSTVTGRSRDVIEWRKGAIHSEGEGEVAVVSAKRWDRRNS